MLPTGRAPRAVNCSKTVKAATATLPILESVRRVGILLGQAPGAEKQDGVLEKGSRSARRAFTLCSKLDLRLATFPSEPVLVVPASISQVGAFFAIRHDVGACVGTGLNRGIRR